MSLREQALVAQGEGEDGEDLVAVDDVALVVDRQAAVGVAVEGEAGVGTVLDDGTLEGPQVRRSAAVVDVEAVGGRVDRDHLGAGVAQRERAGLVRRALRAVEDDLEPVEGLGRGRDEVGGVVGDRGVVRRDATDVTTGRALPLLAHPTLDGDLDRVVELVAAAGQELDAVVGHRVVRGREHDAEVDAELVGQVRDTRGRQDAEQEHVDTRRGEAGDDGRLEELSGDARVPTDHGTGAVPRELSAVGQDMGSGHGQVQGQLRRQGGVRQAPDPVRAEESSHGARRQPISAC